MNKNYYNMDYEKKYKEALEWMQSLYSGLHGATKEDAEHYFPELKEKESEDERIRREIIEYITLYKDSLCDEEYNSWITWLEKQDNKSVNIDVESMVSLYEQRLKSQGGTKYSPLVNMCLTAFRHGVENVLEELNLKKLEKQDEKKSTDNVESKFHEGEWITNGYDTWKIVGIKPLDYILQSQDGNIVDDTISYVDEQFHPFTIEDAKAGDVLVCKGNIKDSNGIKYERICLFNNLDNAFFTLTKTSNYVEEFDIDVNIDYPDNTIPATKGQKEILFMAMRGAGYEWDADKKELEKIKTKTLDPDKVIKWLKNTIKERAENYGVYKETRLILPYNSIEDLINDFKEDFGL